MASVGGSPRPVPVIQAEIRDLEEDHLTTKRFAWTIFGLLALRDWILAFTGLGLGRQEHVLYFVIALAGCALAIGSLRGAGRRDLTLLGAGVAAAASLAITPQSFYYPYTDDLMPPVAPVAILLVIASFAVCLSARKIDRHLAQLRRELAATGAG